MGGRRLRAIGRSEYDRGSRGCQPWTKDTKIAIPYRAQEQFCNTFKKNCPVETGQMMSRTLLEHPSFLPVPGTTVPIRIGAKKKNVPFLCSPLRPNQRAAGLIPAA